MTGSLRNRGRDSWQLRVYVGLDARTGRQRWATTTVHGTKRYASAQLAEFVEHADYARVRAGTVADLLDRWLAAASPRWSPNTDREHRSVVNRHLRPLLGHLPVAKVTAADIDDLYAHLLARGRADGGPLAPATVARIHAVVHRVFAQAVRWEWVWFNPVSNASPPRVTPAEVTPPTPRAVSRLLADVRSTNPAFFTYLRLAASTGARRSQLLGLRWAEVDYTHRAVGFTRAFVEGPNGCVVRATKTHRSYRVSLDEATMAQLVDHWRRAWERARAAGQAVTADGFVFSDDVDGARPWLPNRVTKLFIQQCRRSGIAHCRLHDLRHFMATEMLANGIPVPTVSQRLGHARASTTLNVYAHRIPGADREAADLLARVLDGSA
jgi:integrase